MPAIQDIPEAVFEETITKAVQDVFSTMLGLPARHIPAEPADPANILVLEQPHVVGTVGFIGALNGLIYLYLDNKFANHCAGNLLGMDAAEIADAGDECVNNAIGELTNMTVGTFKNQLSDRGFPCKLTIPSILRGSRFSIEPISSATRRIYRFDLGGHTLTADLLMQPGE